MADKNQAGGWADRTGFLRAMAAPRPTKKAGAGFFLLRLDAHHSSAVTKIS